MKTAHEHMKKHAKKAHEHIKRHGKWYIYGHILAASLLFSIVSNYNANSRAADIDAPVCSETYENTKIVLDYAYTDPKKDIILQGISFDNIIFPDLVLVKNVKQVTPKNNNNELSTDRWDLAWYTNINKEDPTEKEIAEYLSNSNLNNIIDGEGRSEVKLDIEFEEYLSDNTSSGDAVGEIIVFERGMNSDIYIQAIDKLGGKELWTKLFLSRKEMTYAGFDVDTIEIGAAQKMGYWRIDLSKLGVSNIKYVRISSLPVNSWPDFKIIGLNTKKCQKKQPKPLQGAAICSAYPNAMRYWKIVNPNDEEINFTWDIYKTTQTGGQTVAKQGEVIIEAKPLESEPTVLRVYVDGLIQNIVPSTEEKCPILQPENSLEIEPLCSPSPEEYRVWKVKNNNPQAFEFSRKMKSTLSCDGNKVVVCQVPPGNPENEHEICIAKQAVDAHIAKGSYLGVCTKYMPQDVNTIAAESETTIVTPIPENNQGIAILVDGVEHDIAMSSPVLCPKQPVNDYSVTIVSDKREVMPYEEILYTIEYKNQWPEALESGFLDLYFDENLEYIPDENREFIEEHHYRMFLPTIVADSWEIKEIIWKIKWEVISGSEVSLEVVLTGERDVNKENNKAISKVSVKEILPLELTSLCSDNPSAVRSWRIENPNMIAIPVDIYVNDEFSVSVVATANDFTYIKTNTVEWTNTVSLLYNGKKQIEKSSENVLCPKPISDLAVENIDVQMISQDTFVTEITFKNFWPNISNEITIDVAWEDTHFIGENQSETELHQTVQEMEVNEVYVLSLTWTLVSWDAQLAVTIDGKAIDPNIYNNNSQRTISRTEELPVPEEDIIPEKESHAVAEDQPETIQGYEIGEKVDLDKETETVENMEDIIGVGCHYTDEEYEKIKFEDVINHRSKPYVELLRVNCIVKGREANAFVTDDYIKRAEAIKVAIKLRGINNDWKVKSDKYIYLGETPMADVNNAHWAAQYIDKAYQIGLLDNLYQGTTNKKVLPERSITRGESIELLVKTYLLLKDTSLETSSTDITTIFDDVDLISSYTPYITYAYEKGFLQGVIDGEKTNFLPNQPISRSEFAKIVALVFKDFLTVYRMK